MKTSELDQIIANQPRTLIMVQVTKVPEWAVGALRGGGTGDLQKGDIGYYENGTFVSITPGRKCVRIGLGASHIKFIKYHNITRHYSLRQMYYDVIEHL
jgi:hypothetical protein